MNNLESDPFSKWRKKEDSIDKEYKAPLDPLYKYRKSLQDISEDNPLKRGIARTISRVGETIAGIPGDLVKTAKFIGESLPDAPEFLKREPSFIQKLGSEALESIPGSQEIGKFVDESTKGYTEPQTEEEELGDDIIREVSSLLVSKVPFKRAVTTGIGSQVAGKLAGEFLQDKDVGRGVGAAITFLSTLGKSSKQSGGVEKFRDRLYSQAESLLPKNASIKSFAMEDRLDRLTKKLQKSGIHTDDTRDALEKVRGIKTRIDGNSIGVDEIWEAKKRLNKSNKLSPYHQEISDILDQSLESYGKSNPKFLKALKTANEAHSGIKKSARFQNTLQKWAENNPNLAKGVAYKIFSGDWSSIVKGAAATAGASGGVKGTQILKRIADNPTLRNYYLNVIYGGIRGDLGSLNRNIAALEKELKDSEEEYN